MLRLTRFKYILGTVQDPYDARSLARQLKYWLGLLHLHRGHVQLQPECGRAETRVLNKLYRKCHELVEDHEGLELVEWQASDKLQLVDAQIHQESREGQYSMENVPPECGSSVLPYYLSHGPVPGLRICKNTLLGKRLSFVLFYEVMR